MRPPKETFIQSGHAGTFAKLASTDCFEVACQSALLQLLFEMPPTHVEGMPTDPYVGLDSNSQMYGARRVLAILMDLPNPNKAAPAKEPPTLNYD